MEQLPQTDAILVPVGGGGLIAGIAVAVKQINTLVRIYVRNISFPQNLFSDKTLKLYL